MRVGVVLSAPNPAERAPTAAIADDAGLDLVLIEGTSHEDALLTASSLAHTVRWTRIAAVVPVGMHPVHLAERICVADQVLDGRLTIVLQSTGCRDELSETLEVLDKALAARPFRHRGTRWQIPANLPENHDATWRKVRITPASVQPRVPIWLSGAGADEVAADFALPYLPPDHVDPGGPASWWEAFDERWGPAAARLSRPLLIPSPEGETLPDTSDMARRLLDEQSSWGLDTVLLRWPIDDPDVLRAATILRASTQLDQLPVGLEDFWTETVTASRHEVSSPGSTQRWSG